MTLSWSEPALAASAAASVGAGAGVALSRLTAIALGRLSPTRKEWLKKRFTVPYLLATTLLMLKLADPYADWAHRVSRMAAQSQHVALVVAVAWLLARGLWLFEVVLVDRLEGPPSADARVASARARLSLLRKLLTAVVGLSTAALVLMSFAELRPLGECLLALPGIAGLLFGIAAHGSMTNFAAGLQILLTDSLHVNDVVAFEGGWGTVEDLTFTSAVIRSWDLRCLTVPLRCFLEKPFQHWTQGAGLLATVTLWVCFDTDIQQLRRLFLERLHTSPRWDRRFASLEVAHAAKSAVQIRCVVSAKDVASLWALRCEVREELLAWARRMRVSGCRHPAVTSAETEVQGP